MALLVQITLGLAPLAIRHEYPRPKTCDLAREGAPWSLVETILGKWTPLPPSRSQGIHRDNMIPVPSGLYFCCCVRRGDRPPFVVGNVSFQFSGNSNT